MWNEFFKRRTSSFQCMLLLFIIRFSHTAHVHYLSPYDHLCLSFYLLLRFFLSLNAIIHISSLTEISNNQPHNSISLCRVDGDQLQVFSFPLFLLDMVCVCVCVCVRFLDERYVVIFTPYILFMHNSYFHHEEIEYSLRRVCSMLLNASEQQQLQQKQPLKRWST